VTADDHGPYAADDAEVVTLVNEQGHPIGEAGRVEAHRGNGMLHRALTCLIFSDAGELLMARRARHKPLWPGNWDGTVATHQRSDESDEAAARRRIPEELNVSVSDVISLGLIKYHAQWNDDWAEREACEVLAARITGQPSPNPDEIDELAWVSLDRLNEFTTGNSTAPWFFLAWKQIQDEHADRFQQWLIN
jgi:isopentenyl-diphosphate delta-isomerase